MKRNKDCALNMVLSNDREKYESANRSSLIQLVRYIFHRLYSNAPKLTDTGLLVYSTFESYAVSISRSQTKNLNESAETKCFLAIPLAVGSLKKGRRKKILLDQLSGRDNGGSCALKVAPRNIITRRGKIPCADPGGNGEGGGGGREQIYAKGIS